MCYAIRNIYHAPVLYPFEVVLALPFKHSSCDFHLLTGKHTRHAIKPSSVSYAVHNRVHTKAHCLQQTFLSQMASWWPGHRLNYSLSSGKICYILTLRNIITKFQRKTGFCGHASALNYTSYAHTRGYLQLWNVVCNNHDKTDGINEDSSKIDISAGRVRKNELRNPRTHEMTVTAAKYYLK